MKKIYALLFLTILVNFLLAQQINADLVLLNGKIFTARDSTHFVEAMAIKDGQIIAIGQNSQLQAMAGANTRQINLRGKLVLPGFHDAHLHFWSGALLNHQLNLSGMRSKEDVLKKIKKAVDKLQPGEWLVGRGWDHELWEDRQLPTHLELDQISSQNPIFLKRVDGHAAWVNKKVLQIIGYDRSTPDPAGGKILRFPENGELTGILIDNAFSPVEQILPEPPRETRLRILQEAIAYANSLGITSITDNSETFIFEDYVRIIAEKPPSLRIHFWIYFQSRLDTLRNWAESFQSDPRFLCMPLVKFFADGSMGSRSAFVLQPYADDPNNFGLPQHQPDELFWMINRVYHQGWIIGVHAIGDAANRMVLDVFEHVRPSGRPDKPRLRIEHAQFVQPDDIIRFAQLGVIASMQPSHCISDMKWVEQRVGDAARYTYSWRSMLEQGVVLAFGTDWPVEPLNPLLGIYAAITRQDTSGYPLQGWYPEQRLRVAEAILAYTTGSAYAVEREDWLGRLLPGYVADFIILDRDIFSIPSSEILKTRVEMTFVNGREVYSSGSF